MRPRQPQKHETEVDSTNVDEIKKKHDECVEADYYSCEEAVKRLNEYLDHQLTDIERVVVLKHLEICRPCLRRFTFEKTLIISLRQKVAHQCVPFTLREKLHGMLRDKSE